MNWDMHILFGLGIVAGTLLVYAGMNGFLNTPINYYDISMAILVGVGFSILPDIDHKYSYASFLLKTFIIILVILLLTNMISFTDNNLLLLAYSLSLLFYSSAYGKKDHSHRQFPHTFVFGILGSLIMLTVFNSFMLFIISFACFSAHLVLDKHLNLWKPIIK